MTLISRILGRGAASAEAEGGLAVSRMARGQRGRIVATLGGEDEREQLRSLGLEPGVEVVVCRAGSTCVLGVGFACGGSCRIGVDRSMASRILVDCTHERASVGAL